MTRSESKDTFVCGLYFNSTIKSYAYSDGERQVPLPTHVTPTWINVSGPFLGLSDPQFYDPKREEGFGGDCDVCSIVDAEGSILSLVYTANKYKPIFAVVSLNNENKDVNVFPSFMIRSKTFPGWEMLNSVSLKFRDGEFIFVLGEDMSYCGISTGWELMWTIDHNNTK